jgi:hypothetical protein
VSIPEIYFPVLQVILEACYDLCWVVFFQRRVVCCPTESTYPPRKYPPQLKHSLIDTTSTVSLSVHHQQMYCSPSLLIIFTILLMQLLLLLYHLNHVILQTVTKDSKTPTLLLQYSHNVASLLNNQLSDYIGQTIQKSSNR